MRLESTPREIWEQEAFAFYHPKGADGFAVNNNWDTAFKSVHESASKSTLGMKLLLIIM